MAAPVSSEYVTDIRVGHLLSTGPANAIVTVMNDITIASAGLRGPAETEKRDAIVAAAEDHFSLYGYSKTTVSDLAKAIGYSKGYIYKFFESKQAIGEAICGNCLANILSAVDESIRDGISATDKFRRLFKTITERSAELFFEDRKLYDIAAVSAGECWPSSQKYVDQVATLLRQIILEGREAGEFERKTPLDETVRSIMQVMQPFMHPLMLEHNLDVLPDAANEAASLVLRSLAP
ncbi:TetR/AcrR family transcriptional regulator [Sphingobium sp. H39-3-25]|uniref:TetR/AcrR family transcriptional regulator n=1 Tax=Sphingobium arseniciresistens TaxID=3030834 RepID=UPI0023B99A67|nr:TetR/AcrR family transcriptional regulator [Sphingobium arseniciresistens]